MSPTRSTRARKMVKLKRRPAPRPERMEAPRPEGSRQARDWIATQPDAARQRQPITSKTIAIWGVSFALVLGLLTMLIAAASWIYDASAPATSTVSRSGSQEMPSSPRRGAATGDNLGGTGGAGRMALIDGQGSGVGNGGGSGSGAAAGQSGKGSSGRSSTCRVQVTSVEELEQTLSSCIEQHNAP